MIKHDVSLEFIADFFQNRQNRHDFHDMGIHSIHVSSFFLIRAETSDFKKYFLLVTDHEEYHKNIFYF